MDDIRPRLEKALGDAYEFKRELGGGGMSRTYLAIETALQRSVVIKVLAPELLAGMSVERFRREILLAAQLQHPHVVPVLAAGEVDGVPWFSMPYIDGDSLRDRLARGAVGIPEAVAILRDVARALAFAHARGVVHRDIKPDNVLLSGRSATVTDFGIAKALSAARGGDGHAGERLTQIGTSMGTPTYMAPEQAAGDPDTDHRADLYAFGVMAFEMLAGQPPFQGTTPAKLLAAHMSETPPDLGRLRPDCPPTLAALIARCLAKEPESRPTDARELEEVLDSITSSGTGVVVPEILRGGQIHLGRAVALWAAAAAIVILTAWAAREVIGLPDWVLPGAVGVMLAGLPVLLFTAYVQRMTHRAFTATPSRTPPPMGTMATIAMKASPHLSWRRTWLGGAIAVGAFAVLVIGFMVMRALGVGPMASLKGQGAFGDRERIMVADFRSPAGDSTLGATIAEALRTDLAQSESLDILSRSTIRDALALMQRSPDESVPFPLAREIATREGAKAVLDGGIAKLGESYVITARLASAADGTDLATFREEAASENDLLTALGRLTKAVRAKAGESLRSIRASGELARVTTPSLEALRKYVEGTRLADEAGESDRGIALLREAVAIDTAFAMAWRKLGVLLFNSGRDVDDALEATSTAYRHRDRLSEMERLLTEAFYFSFGPRPDDDRALAAYEAALQLDSLNSTALNNAANLYGRRYMYERQEEMLRRVVRLPDSFGLGFTNLLNVQIRNRRSGATLDSTLQLFRERLGESNDFWEGAWLVAWGKGDIATADSIALAVQASPATSRQALNSATRLSFTAEMEGRLAESIEQNSHNSETTYRLDPKPGNRLLFAIDTAYYEALYGDRNAALAAIARGRSRVPMHEVAPNARPWYMLAWIGAMLQDPALAKEALQGWERDQAGIAFDSVGAQAGYATFAAFAEQNWTDVIAQTRVAEQRFEMPPRFASLFRGFAYEGLGQADSAIVSLERYLETPDPSPSIDAAYRARVLQRLGELYEGKGDNARAIEYYSRFADLWKDADAKLQPQVREARQRVAALRGKVG